LRGVLVGLKVATYGAVDIGLLSLFCGGVMDRSVHAGQM